MSFSHLNPLDFNYLDYYSYLERNNIQFKERVIKSLEEELGEICEGMCIGCVGSDARNENWGSKIELLFINLCDDELSFELIFNYILNSKIKEYLADAIEVKNRTTNDLFNSRLLIRGKKESVIWSPYRTIDSLFLFGDFSALEFIKTRFLEYGLSNKELIERMKKRRNSHKKISETGEQRFKGEKLEHYNINEGFCIYDLDSHLWSFKQGPLRYVQYALSYRIISSKLKDLLYEPNTKKRIEFLNSIRIINKDYKDSLIDTYLFFLHQYHISQYEFYVNQRKRIMFNPKLRREIEERLNQLNNYITNI
ncbi:MAG: hypothetical protein QXE31_00480 [Candidatus Woesearchaeota archaeon]